MGRALFFNFLTMLISPTLGVIPAFSKNYDRRLRKWILIIFITFFGSVLIMIKGSDAEVHLSRVKSYYIDLTFAEFLGGAKDIIFFVENMNVQEDLYIHILSYVSGGLLGLPGLFFVFVLFIYGYFYISSLFKLIALRPELKYTYSFYFLLFVLIFFRGIDDAGTVRTWTGLMVLFYGVIGYYTERRFKYLILICLTPYIHFGYFIMVIPTIIVIIFGFRSKLYISLYILSFFMSFLNPQSSSVESGRNEVVESTVSTYYVEVEDGFSEKYEKSSQLGGTWYRSLSKSGLHNWPNYIFSFIIIGWGFYPGRMTMLENGLFSIGLLTKVLSSSTWFIIALSNRTSIISDYFILAAFYLLAQRGAFLDTGPVTGFFQKFLFQTSLIMLVPFMIMKLSGLLSFFSFFLLSGPFLVWFSRDINFSINEFVKILIDFI